MRRQVSLSLCAADAIVASLEKRKVENTSRRIRGCAREFPQISNLTAAAHRKQSRHSITVQSQFLNLLQHERRRKIALFYKSSAIYVFFIYTQTIFFWFVTGKISWREEKPLSALS